MVRPFSSNFKKLMPCAQRGANAELFLVEGDSACSAVAGVRDATFQAVLPMQGKPLNAWRASAARSMDFELFQTLAQTLNCQAIDAEAPPTAPTLFDRDGHSSPLLSDQYGKVLLLFDPDADGIHCGALMLLYLYRFHRPMMEAGRIEMVRAPMFEMQWADADGQLLPTMHVWTEAEYQRRSAELLRQGAHKVQSQRFRGLGSLNPELLRRTCVHPQTRKTSVMTAADARAIINVFGGLSDV